MAIKSEINKKDLINLQEISNEEFSRIYEIVGAGVEPAISNALREPSTTLTTSPNDSNLITKEDFVNTHDNEINQRNVALIDKQTRSQYLEGKTELTDEDIIHLLDLSPEKTAANIEIYTEKSYKELKGNPEELARLTKELTSSEYLRYKETFISKSKLLYEQSSVLYNEIPCLIVLNEMKIPSYLLPYEYAKNKQGDTRHFADSLKENAFTDFKRVFNTKIRHSFENGMEQGRDIFFLVNNEKLDKEEIKIQLEKLIKFHKGQDKQGLFLFYSEKDYKCFSFETDYLGKITENNDYDLKKLRLAIPDKPFTPNLERTNTNERPRSDDFNITPSGVSVNELFYSLLKRGEITALATLKDLSDRENRYYEAVSDMERTNNTIFSDFLKKSNTAFLLKEKQSRFYKDIFKLIPQGERTMPGEKQIIAEIGFADGEIRQYEDSVPFLKDLNEATRENAYDTNFRVYADSDELKQKAADVKLDNYDPIKGAERMHNGYEWNDVEHEAVQFTQSAEGRRLLKDAENGRLTMLDARDILDAVEKNGMTLRYDPLPNSYVVDGWTAADGEKLDNYVVSMSELKRLAGIKISENSQQNQIKKGNLEYIDEKRSREWAVRQRLQLPPLTDILGYSPNLTTKEDFVNSQKSLSKKRNVAHEEAPTQGDKSMPGEKKELSFSEQVDLVLAGKYNRFDALKVCDTPDLLLQSGLKQLPMLYTQRHLREAIQQKDLHNHTHGIKIEQIKSLPELIKNPVMIYDSLSRSESLLVLTSEIDVDKMPIVVSIRPNGKGTYELKKVDSNFITSMYGRENFEQHINSVVNNGKIIYWNKEKSQALFSVLGQRLPKGLNNLDPYKILHQTNSVVNTQFQTRTTEQETPTIKNNNEKSQERHSDAKDYLIQTTRLFLSKLKEKNLPFLRGKERGPNIIIRPQAARDAATGKAFTGYTQLMAQALIQALYDQKKLPELEYDLITYDQAKACGTFIKKGSPHITLTNYNRTTNSASKQMYYFKSGCNSPEMIDLHKESIARNRAIKRIRLSLENKEIPSERQSEEKNKITLLHYEEMTYLKALNKDTEQYFDSLTAEEKEMLKTLCSKEPLTQKTVKELAETLRKDRLISAQLSSQKNSGRSFDATECIVPEDFIGKAMAAASLGCSLETTQSTIDRITKDLHQTLSRNIEHYDYGKPFETGEIINGKCRNNVKDMCNKEYEAEELAKKIEQQQMALKKNPINALMELLNRNDLSDRTIGGYER